MPTFQLVEDQEAIEVVTNERPEPVQRVRNLGPNYHFIFLVDTSGSKNDSACMDLTKEVLTLFMKSLPASSKFSIISCGSVDSLFSEIKYGEQGPIFDLSDQTIKLAMGLIQNMTVKPGDARVFEHIKAALTDQEYDSGKVKRVFILSFGKV